MAWPPNCYFCGKFIGYKDFEKNVITWTPYGGYYDDEPPDEEFAHKACWEKQEENRKDLVKRVAWIPPSIGR